MIERDYIDSRLTVISSRILQFVYCGRTDPNSDVVVPCSSCIFSDRADNEAWVKRGVITSAWDVVKWEQNYTFEDDKESWSNVDGHITTLPKYMDINLVYNIIFHILDETVMLPIKNVRPTVEFVLSRLDPNVSKLQFIQYCYDKYNRIGPTFFRTHSCNRSTGCTWAHTTLARLYDILPEYVPSILSYTAVYNGRAFLFVFNSENSDMIEAFNAYIREVYENNVDFLVKTYKENKLPYHFMEEEIRMRIDLERMML